MELELESQMDSVDRRPIRVSAVEFPELFYASRQKDDLIVLRSASYQICQAVCLSLLSNLPVPVKSD